MTLLLEDRPRSRPSTELVDELTRRGLLTGTIGGAALTLAGCGSRADEDSAPTTTDRTIETAKGKVTVPARPTRVVAIQPSATATLYDLGVSPVGNYDQGAQYVSPRYVARWKSSPKIGDAGEIDVEKVAAARPDVIIGVDYPWNTNVYSELTRIAPTVIAPADTWQDIARTTADAVNRLDRLAALRHRLTTRSAAIASAHAETLGRYRWDILQGGFDKGRFWLYGPHCDAGSILAEAGVRFARGTASVAGTGPKALSYERIDTLADADVIGFYAGYDDKPNNEGPALFSQAGFQRLRAAKAGALVPLPDFLPGGYGDALALLDELESGLEKVEATR